LKSFDKLKADIGQDGIYSFSPIMRIKPKRFMEAAFGGIDIID